MGLWRKINSLVETGKSFEGFRHDDGPDAVHDAVAGQNVGAEDLGVLDFDPVVPDIDFDLLAVHRFHVTVLEVGGENLAGDDMIEQQGAELLLVLGEQQLGQNAVWQFAEGIVGRGEDGVSPLVPSVTSSPAATSAFVRMENVALSAIIAVRVPS